MSFRDDLQTGLDDIAAIGWEDITYNGKPIKASIDRGQERQGITRGAVANEMVITVKRSDVDAAAKDTLVVVDGENWKVWAKVGGTRLTWRIKLYNGGSPIPRRSL